MTDKPKSQTIIVCGHCDAEIDAGDFEPDTTRLDPPYRGRTLRCPKCSGEIIWLLKGDKPAD